MLSRRDAIKLGTAGVMLSSVPILERPVGFGEAVVLAEASDATVPTLGGNAARTGEMPGPGPSLDLPIVKKWQVSDGVEEEGRGAPAIVDGVAYVTTSYGLQAVRIDTAKIMWEFMVRYSGGSPAPMNGPTVRENVVYVGCANSRVYAIDAMTGKQRWNFSTEFAVDSAPAVLDGAVYFGCGHTLGERYVFYCLDAGSGAERWRFEAKGSSTSAPAVADGTVYFGGRDDYLYAVDTGTGQERWKFKVDGSLFTPTVVDGAVYLSSEYGFYVLDTVSGEEIWRFDDFYAPAPPSVHNGVLYLSGEQGDDVVLKAFDVSTAQLLWTLPLSSGGSPEKPAIADGIVYASVSTAIYSGLLFAIAADTGQGIWVMESAGTGSPVVVNGMIFMSDNFLSMIGNLSPTVLAEDVVLRASPSNSGLERGSATAGTEVSSLGSQEERNGTVWVEATIGGVTGWIPLDAIDPATLPPEGEIRYAEML